MDVEPDTDTEDVFFHHNGDRGEETKFLAQRGVDRWILTRFDTPQGPMIEHDFGPFADTYGDWIGPYGVASCIEGGPWSFARAFLLERWDELRALPKAIGLDPSDSRAQSRPALVTAAAGRAAARLSTDGAPSPQDDDDIPF